MRALPRVFAAGTALVLVVSLSGCSWFGGGHKSKTTSVSVFKVKAGDCFVAPKDVKAELSKLSKTPCTVAHTQEAYAIVAFASASGATASAYPGADALTTFAQGACAQRYGGYVGVDYLDSSLFFTYLLPSARGWEQDSDHDVLCFVETTGAKLTSTVKGSKK
jgi:hypothetical protein